jgi:dUTP pyrophosphatase
MKIKVVNKSRYALPQYETPHSVGLDVRADIENPIMLCPLERVLVPTGLYVELPEGSEILVRPRSGLAAKHGVAVLNSPGTIDPDYRGEIKVILVNISHDVFEIKPGERIAQLVVSRYEQAEWEEVEQLSETTRGEGGFGSTGRG